MPDGKVNVTGTGSGHLDYPVPGGVEFILKQAYASFDGTSAAAAWYPAVRLIGPDGNVAGEYITGSTVAAGGSADVTFAPFLKGAAAATSTPAVLSWCVATSGNKTVTSGAAAVNFDFSGNFTTNDTTTYTLATQASGNQTPSLNSNGIYLIMMVAQAGNLAIAPAAGSGLKIATSIYGNEPVGNPTVGLFYTDPVTSNVEAKASWLWVLDLGGSGSQPPFSGEIGLRHNAGTNASCSVNFGAVRIDTAGDSIV